ncbi:MAG TPA: hypothetical protein PLH93_05750 [Flavobacteriales bacterium]|nr:hypothetical protein [Flavobacteriales bacterium]HQW86667.1 hypothetical protein [Flavobacteriales bacterium]
MHAPAAVIPVYRALTIVGNVLRIDRDGMAHVPFRSDTTIGAPVEVVFILVPIVPADPS